MTKTCTVCKTEAVPGSDLSFHGFPKGDLLRQQWIKSLNLQSNQYSYKTAVVCSKHFDKKCFVGGNVRRKRRKLLAGSVPVLGNIQSKKSDKCDNYSDVNSAYLLIVGEPKKRSDGPASSIAVYVMSSDDDTQESGSINNSVHSNTAQIIACPCTYKKSNLKRASIKRRRIDRVKFMHGKNVKYLSREDFSSNHSWTKFLQYRAYCKSKVVSLRNGK